MKMYNHKNSLAQIEKKTRFNQVFQVAPLGTYKVLFGRHKIFGSLSGEAYKLLKCKNNQYVFMEEYFLNCQRNTLECFT